MLISLISSADQVTDARMHRLCGALIRSGFQVEVWALGSAQNAPTGVDFHRAPGGTGFAARILRDVVLPLRARGTIWIVVAPDLLPMSWLISRIITSYVELIFFKIKKIYSICHLYQVSNIINAIY